MGKNTSSLPLRRSGRVNIGFPVKITGILANDLPFAEDAEIITISKFGAKLKTHLPLNVGMQVKVQPRRGRKAGVFKVVWVGREGTLRAGEVGVEYNEEVTSLLGVTFPEQ
jgi:hypothetical protein